MKIVREYPGIFVGPGEGPVFHYGCRPLNRQEGTTGQRRKRDSNPRYGSPYSGFQDRRFQPLTHSSVFENTL